ncbi:glycosyltransferase family A protein [Sulfurimonas sp. NWX79]|uniref:glycosyltransferase family 2 protein n=1 Tax=Sulfurimonas sp. NWX79 TaxID=2925412 RepID=UPI0032049F3A
MDITVIIPTYNRYELLKRAITSVYAQTHPPKELIIIDDGSTDNTKQITKDFPDIIYIYQENRGVSCARNVGIKATKYEWIAFLDSDDEWDEKKLEKQVSFHESNPDILMSYTAEQWIRNGQVIKIPKKYRKVGDDIFMENLSYCNIAPSSVVMHKKLFESVGLFDESLPVCEDYDLWLRILLKHKVGLINEKLIIKHAGHDKQLGFSKDLDKYRMYALEKLLQFVEQKEMKEEIAKELEAKMNYHGIFTL